MSKKKLRTISLSLKSCLRLNPTKADTRQESCQHWLSIDSVSRCHTSVSLMTGCPRGWSLITDGMVPGLPTLHYSCDGAQQSRPGPTGSGVNCQVPAPASAPWPGEPEQPPLTTGHWVMVQPVAPLPSSPSLRAQQLSPGQRRVTRAHRHHQWPPHVIRVSAPV